MEGSRTVHVGASWPYDVHVGAGILSDLGAIAREAAGGRSCCVITETNVGPLYAEAAEESLDAAGYKVADTLEFPAGERQKRFSTLEVLLEGLAERGLTRDDVVVALGGGVTGDIAGMAAALYLRGVHVVQVPTSLLAMVDSSVGGKTAVDLRAGKNLAGAFWQPTAVVADVRCLATIEHDLLTDSCGEVVKHAVLADPALLDELTAEPLNGEGVSEQRLVDVVTRNVEIKRDVVAADEKESGIRQTLNLGHTVGHAIEAASEFKMGHGSCVAAGLCVVARASAKLGWCSGETADRIVACIEAHKLPTTTAIDRSTLMYFMSHDKKRRTDGVNLVVPAEIGRAEIRRVSLEELGQVVDLGCEA